MSNEQQHRDEPKPLRASVNYEEPGHAYPSPDRELMPKELADHATRRRVEREEAFVRTTTVAGHDFRREHQERERERGR